MPLSYRRIGLMGAVFCLLFLDFWLRWGGLSLPVVCNRGIAFGMALPQSLVLLGGSVVLMAILFLWKSEKEIASQAGYFFILLGGIGNLIDRVLTGCVHDYLSLPFWPTFPSFNLSDMMLSLGVVCLIFGLYRKSAPSRE